MGKIYQIKYKCGLINFYNFFKNLSCGVYVTKYKENQDQCGIRKIDCK
jgi:hypothetical protein